jgi:hypothetical protein
MEDILLYDVIFEIYDKNGDSQLYQAPKIDFSHIIEYVEKKDLVSLSPNPCEIVLKKLHTDWGENWDMVIDFFGQELADQIDKAVGYDPNN